MADDCGASLPGWLHGPSSSLLLNFGLRAALPGYHAAEATLQFTLAMKIGRLTEAALTSLAAGAIVGLIAPRRMGAVAGGPDRPGDVPAGPRRSCGTVSRLVPSGFLVPLAPLVALGGAPTRGRRRKPRLLAEHRQVERLARAEPDYVSRVIGEVLAGLRRGRRSSAAPRLRARHCATSPKRSVGTVIWHASPRVGPDGPQVEMPDRRRKTRLHGRGELLRFLHRSRIVVDVGVEIADPWLGHASVYAGAAPPISPFNSAAPRV